MTREELVYAGTISNHGGYASLCVKYNKTYIKFLQNNSADNDLFNELLKIREELKIASETIYKKFHG